MMSGRIEFTLTESSNPVPRLGGDEPFRILVLGDFSGRAARGAFSPGDLSERRLHAVDVDTLDAVLRRVGASLPVLDSGALLTFGGIEDLHPDRIVARVPALAELLRLYRRLGSPSTAADAAVEVRARFGPATQPEPAEPSARPGGESDSDTLGRLMGSPRGERESAAPARSTLDRLLRGAVEGHVVPAAGAAHGVYVDVVLRALTAGVASILGREDVRRLESSWLSLGRLVRSLETGADLGVHLLDVAREEIAADFATSAGSIRETELFRRLGAQGPGGPDRPGWSTIVLDVAFGSGEDDVALLGSLGRLAAALQAPIVAGASPAVAGVPSWGGATDPAAWSPAEAAEARWKRLRRSDAARWLGLCAPRLLLRQPYGPDSDPVESFPFDEWPWPHDSSGLPWGNGAFGCAQILGRRVLAGGPEPGDTDLEDLPACVVPGRDGPSLVPCAEAFLGEGAVLGLLERGVMPWISDRGLPRARLVRMQSLADPPARLPGAPGE